MGRIQRYRKSLANGLLFHKLLEILERVGVMIEPYYFYEEHITLHPGLSPDEAAEEYEFFEADWRDTDALAAMNEHHDTRTEILGEFNRGRRCFALRHRDRIIASSWCDLDEIHFPPCRRALRRDEAYIFRTEVVFAYRGKGAASYLRTMIYRFLGNCGHNVLYSYTDALNRPAVRFKKKIGAHTLFFGLSVRIAGTHRKNWIFGRRESVIRPAPHLHATSLT